MSKRVLYDANFSGHAHRPRALLSLLGLSYEPIIINFSKGDHRTLDFLKLNPLGQVPVFIDGDVIIRDSTAVLVYLAKAYGQGSRSNLAVNGWLPEDTALAAEVQSWLAVSSKEIHEGPVIARARKLFGEGKGSPEAVKNTHNLFTSLFEPHLEKHDWLVGNSITIADIANYGYISTSPEADIDLQQYPQISAWLDRLESIEGFPKMPSAHDAKRGLVKR